MTESILQDTDFDEALSQLAKPANKPKAAQDKPKPSRPRTRHAARVIHPETGLQVLPQDLPQSPKPKPPTKRELKAERKRKQIEQLAVDNPKLSQKAIAKLAGTDAGTVKNILDDREKLRTEANDYREKEIDFITHLCKRLLNSLTDDEIKKMTPSQRIVSTGILTDKRAVLTGKQNPGGGGNGVPVVIINFSGVQPAIGANPNDIIDVTQLSLDPAPFTRQMDKTPIVALPAPIQPENAQDTPLDTLPDSQ